MIEYRKGNLLDVTEGIIVHGCNMQGIMGAGVAKAVKAKYPACFDDYCQRLATGFYVLGEVINYKVNSKLYISNALTQQYFGRAVRQVNYAAIVRAFDDNIAVAQDTGLSLHFPKIGAGLGGGDWNIIEQLINDCDPDDTVQKICWEL